VRGPPTGADNALMPKVSIITPCYKAERFIARTLESVRAQTLVDWEHIVVDDGSPDDSAAVVREFAARDPRVRLLRQPNGGMENARNNGYAACSTGSEFLLFLDADDCLEPEALATLAGYLEVRPEVGLAYCARTWIDADDRPLEEANRQTSSVRFVPIWRGARPLPDTEPETPLAALVAFHLAIPSSCLIRRAVYARTGGWDERLRRKGFEDLDMVMQCALLAPVHYVPAVLLRYRRHGDSASRVTDLVGDRAPFAQKWSRGEGLTREQARRVRRAFDFDRYLAAHLQFRAAREEVHRRDLRKGLFFWAQGVKKALKFLLALARREGAS